MKTSILSLLIILVATSVSGQILGYPDGLYTRAERTQYQETSLHSDVMTFIQLLDAGSDLVNIETIGTSKEGKNIPLVIMSRPGIASPAEAAASGKAVIYIQANIHGGEVEGKEACLIMMREMAFGQKKHLLDNQIILFCPIYNADGNDKLSPNNRSNQDGSPAEAGERYSGEGYDLNRDGLKLESLEGSALTENVILRWDPIMFVDLHTTNGTWHGYSLTYAPGMVTAGHPAPTRYLMENLFPEVTEKVRERSGLDTYLYGNFSEFPPKTYNGMLPQPRYLTNSLVLRNMYTILIETFAHDRFERRILSNIAWLTSMLEFTSEKSEEMKSIVANANSETKSEIINNGGQFTRGVKFLRAQSGPLSDLLVYSVDENIDQFGITRNKRTGRRYWVSGVRKMTSVDVIKDATVPKAYVFPAELENVANKLRQHGITVEELTSTRQFSGEEFTVTSFGQSNYNYQGHYLRNIGGFFTGKTMSFTEGSYYVDLETPLAYLIFYLLEPEADDGLAVWNYFDSYLIDNGANTGDTPYPVFKIFDGSMAINNPVQENNFTLIQDSSNDRIIISRKEPIPNDASVELSDSNGRLILASRLIANQSRLELSTSGINKPGVYLIKIKSPGQNISRKILIY